MADPTNDQMPSEDEQPQEGAHNVVPLSSSDGEERDSRVGQSDTSFAIVNAYQPRSHQRVSRWAADTQTSAESPFAHHLDVITNPPSPSRIPIPRITRAQAAVRHSSNSPVRLNSSLPRNEGMWDLHEHLENTQQEDEQEEDEEDEEDEAEAATPLARTGRVWNFAELHEAIRQHEEYGYDPPTPPPPYRERLRTMISQTSSALTLTQTPPPPYRVRYESLTHRSTQTGGPSSRSGVRATDVFRDVALSESVRADDAADDAEDSTNKS